MATHIPNTPLGVPATGLPAVPIDIDAVIGHLAMRPREAQAFVAGLADALIEARDALDADPDLEPNCGGWGTTSATDECEVDHEGEETLGWAANGSQTALGDNTADGDETAPERHGEGFVRCGRDDHEPSLGAPEINAGCSAVYQTPDGRFHRIAADQRDWAKGASDDREHVDEDGTDLDAGEDDQCDMEYGGDEEPSLGSVDSKLDQRGWASGGNEDEEQDGWRRARARRVRYPEDVDSAARKAAQQLQAIREKRWPMARPANDMGDVVLVDWASMGDARV